ncbi:MAG: amino acid adenylation domain-containing protein [Oscillospiraceae bacterium]|nr:amino acid adenylation domain-containing protein [Oscillospiraceae bacterium]
MNNSAQERIAMLSEEQLEALRRKLRDKKRLEKTDEAAIRPVPPGQRARYPLPAGLRRIWLASSMAQDHRLYTIGGIARIRTALRSEWIAEAFASLPARHDILRTGFAADETGTPYAQVAENVLFALKVLDVSDRQADRRTLLDSLVRDELDRPFDLSEPPLLRGTLLCTAPDDWSLLLVAHHLAVDGLSTGIIFQQIIRYYEAKEAGRPPDVGVQPITYADYAWWKRGQCDGVPPDSPSVQYWLDTPTDAPLDFFEDCRPRSDAETRGFRVPLHLEETLVHALKRQAQAQKVTVFGFLLAALFLLIHKYSQQNELVLGVLLSGRDRREIGNLIGCFIDSLPVCLDAGRPETAAAFVRRVYETFVTAVRHKDAYDRAGDRTESRQILFSYEEHPGNHIDVEGARIDFEEIVTGFVRSEMEVELNRLGDVVDGWINCREGLFARPYVEEFAGAYLHLLRAMVMRPSDPIARFEVLSPEKIEQILAFGRGAAAAWCGDRTASEAFAAQVAAHPDKPALFMGSRVVSYRALDDMAARVAHALRAEGAAPEGRVALMAARGVSQIAAVLGILRSGAAYVPLDGASPPARLRRILEDCGARILLTDDPDACEALCLGVRILSLARALAYAACAGPLPVGRSEDLAYVVYTSGTTGAPKGILVEHRQLLATVIDNDYLTYEADDKLLQLSNIAFDGSVFDIFGALLNGAGLVLLDRENAMDVRAIAGTIRDQGVTVMFVTTALFNAIVDCDVSCLPRLRKLFAGGERASEIHMRRALAAMGPGKLHNIYGPTEATVFSTVFPIDACPCGDIPIGRPVSHTSVYIMNRAGNVQPVGVKGEILIGGPRLARGYLNRPELELDKFIACPHEPSGRCYRTGDVGRWRADGQILFCGRRDAQVKLRGFRIELGEIERMILYAPGVKKAVVTLRDDEGRGQYLCAYLETADGFSIETLREILAERLPPYMLPAHYVLLDAIPVTRNGKTDKTKLPPPDLRQARTLAPADTETERILLGLWREVLGREEIGVTENFFDLGGDSIQLSRLSSLMRQHLCVDVSLRALFGAAHIRDMAALVEAGAPAASETPTRLPDGDDYEVSPSQLRMVLLHLRNDKSLAYNIPFAVRIEGPVEPDAFERAVRVLIGRQESLRTSFAVKGNRIVQCVHEQVTFVLDGGRRERSIEEELAAFIRPFDLSAAPLFRLKLLRESDGSHLLLGDFHHAVFDGVSLDIFLREFCLIYGGLPLPPLPFRYRDCAAWQNGSLETEKIRRQRAYWRRQLSGQIPALDIPADFCRPSVKSFAGDTLFFSFDTPLSEAVRQLAGRTRTTLFVVLLSLYKALLWRYTGQEDIVVGTPVAGRTLAGVENIVGLFLNTLCIRSAPRADKSFLAFLEEVKETAVDAFENQDYPYDKLVEDLRTAVAADRNPLFDTMFIMQNAAQFPVDIEGVSFSHVPIRYQAAKFDIKLEAYDMGAQIRFVLDYATDLFRRETIERFIERFTEVTRLACRDARAPLAALFPLKDEDEAQLRAFSEDFV